MFLAPCCLFLDVDRDDDGSKEWLRDERTQLISRSQFRSDEYTHLRTSTASAGGFLPTTTTYTHLGTTEGATPMPAIAAAPSFIGAVEDGESPLRQLLLVLFVAAR